ncbi:hypothetical protein D3C87_1129570 [compost metagenome]
MINPFFTPFFPTKGYTRSILPCKDGSVIIISSVCVFWLCVADNDIREPGIVLNVLLYEIDELNVLFKFEPMFAWLIDCLKYLLLPMLTEAEKVEFGFDLVSLECDHWIL